MNTNKFLLALALTTAMLAISLAKENTTDTVTNNNNEPLSLKGASNRVLAQNYYNPGRATMTCNNFPRICRAVGSAGPDCCRRQCVDVLTDMSNCGRCGKRCNYNETCCHGQCVNMLFDTKNCGGCNNKCKKGSRCTYGMCSYA